MVIGSSPFSVLLPPPPPSTGICVWHLLNCLVSCVRTCTYTRISYSTLRTQKSQIFVLMGIVYCSSTGDVSLLTVAFVLVLSNTVYTTSCTQLKSVVQYKLKNDLYENIKDEYIITYLCYITRNKKCFSHTGSCTTKL